MTEVLQLQIACTYCRNGGCRYCLNRSVLRLRRAERRRLSTQKRNCASCGRAVRRKSLRRGTCRRGCQLRRSMSRYSTGQPNIWIPRKRPACCGACGRPHTERGLADGKPCIYCLIDLIIHYGLEEVLHAYQEGRLRQLRMLM